MRIPLRFGRFLSEADTSEDPLHVVLNQAAATSYGPARIRLTASDGSAAPPARGFRSSASAGVMRFAVRSPLSAERLIPEVRRAIRGVHPTLPIHEVLTMEEIVQDSMALERVGSLLTTFFALAALVSLVLGGGLRMAPVGVVLGAAATVAAVALLARFFELQGVGWLPFGAAASIVAIVTTAATSFPARHAARLSPMAAIRDS